MSKETHSELEDIQFLVIPDKDDGEPTLSFSRTPTVLLTFASNRFTRSASRHYQNRFGVGAMDWRMLVMLTRHPDSSVSQASRTIGIDKGAVSRSLTRLNERGLVTADASHSDERRKSWRLTSQGVALHAEILDVALARQKQLLKGFSAEEVTAMCDYLSRFLENLDRLPEKE